MEVLDNLMHENTLYKNHRGDIHESFPSMRIKLKEHGIRLITNILSIR
jgi:hypothetical protein